MEGVGERVGQMMKSEAGREPKDDGPRRRSLSMEDLRRKYPWWPSSSASKGPSTLIEMDPLPEEEEKLARGVKSTKLWVAAAGRRPCEKGNVLDHLEQFTVSS